MTGPRLGYPGNCVLSKDWRGGISGAIAEMTGWMIHVALNPQ